MESQHFLPASQPTTYTPSWVFPQFVQGSSSLQPPPSSQLRLHDATNFPLPPNTLGISAQGQASRRLPSSFNGPAGQPVRTAKTVAAAKRTTARSHSQPNVWKHVSVSSCARGTHLIQFHSCPRSPSPSHLPSRLARAAPRKQPDLGPGRLRSPRRLGETASRVHRSRRKHPQVQRR